MTTASDTPAANPTRELAAIMFSDVVGYTAIMGRDEDEGLRALAAHRELLRTLLPNFNGRIVGEIGDGTLSSFHSAIDAVQCAREVQAHLSSDPALSVRIGIHLGDVVFSNDTVLGDGVNVASRIHALAPPGGVCISANVYDEIRNKPAMRVKDLGEKTLKNVARPIRVYALQVAAAGDRDLSVRSKFGRRLAIGALISAVTVAIAAAYFYRAPIETALTRAPLWLRGPARPSDSSQWVQLTKLPDSAVQPALSPNGSMVAFIRGESTFSASGQIYVKILPDGEPVQLTHDSLFKMCPAFSPDGSRIAYTTEDSAFHWDTWVVPVLGGEPQLLLKNASGLVWAGPRQVLFSEMKKGIHMAIVTAEESRVGARDVYLPADEGGMAHRSYLSPDGKWVLLVEMDGDHLWEPCRLVPADGSSPGRQVGPPGGGCTSGAWSPDGKWMYLTSNAVGNNHIWRQRFRDGQPEQITSGPTEEEGIAMAEDGRSFVTAVALQSASLWVHDTSGEREISLEGNAAEPKFTPDGGKLLYRIVREPPSETGLYRDPGEVRVANLKSGRSEPLVRGFQALDYDISADGRQVVMETTDREGKPRLWLAPLDRSSPPHQIPNVVGGQPRFGPGGEIFFRRRAAASFQAKGMEGSPGFVYRVRPDGTGMRKALEQAILLLWAVSPDGRWISAFAPLAGNGLPAGQAFPLDGEPPVFIGWVGLGWVPGGVFFAPFFGKGSYIVPLASGQVLPRIPAGGFRFRSEDEIARLPGARRIPAWPVAPGPSPDIYAFYHGTTQRNLYRIPIP
jgi:class 3 adenylate cyclase/Tol biopolymer transport system component